MCFGVLGVFCILNHEFECFSEAQYIHIYIYMYTYIYIYICRYNHRITYSGSSGSSSGAPTSTVGGAPNLLLFLENMTFLRNLSIRFENMSWLFKSMTYANKVYNFLRKDVTYIYISYMPSYVCTGTYGNPREPTGAKKAAGGELCLLHG